MPKLVKHLPSSMEGNVRKERLILAEFKNGNLTSFGKKQLKFTCYKNTMQNTLSFPERILVSKSKTMCYAGSNFETETSKITSSVLKLLVVNKRKSSFKMYDVDYFPLKAQIAGPEVLQIKDDRTYGEKASDLTLTFGSKTLQKSMTTKKRYGACPATSDPTAIPKISDATHVPNLSAESQTSSAIPPQNSSALSVEEVYNLYDIISQDELDALTSNAEVFLAATSEKIKEWKKENNYTLFIVEFLENNMRSMDPHKAKLLCYLHYMFCFLRTVYTDWKRKDPVPSVPEPFKQNLMDSFSVNRSMPQRLKDKLLAHAMVLALKLCNYAFNLNLFTSSAKIPMTRMTAVAYALGCHITDNKTNGMKTIELKLPLYKFQANPKKFKKRS